MASRVQKTAAQLAAELTREGLSYRGGYLACLACGAIGGSMSLGHNLGCKSHGSACSDLTTEGVVRVPRVADIVIHGAVSTRLAADTTGAADTTDMTEAADTPEAEDMTEATEATDAADAVLMGGLKWPIEMECPRSIGRFACGLPYIGDQSVLDEIARAFD